MDGRTGRGLDLNLVPLGGLARAVANRHCGTEVDATLLVAIVVKVGQRSTVQHETPPQPVCSKATVQRKEEEEEGGGQPTV